MNFETLLARTSRLQRNSQPGTALPNNLTTVGQSRFLLRALALWCLLATALTAPPAWAWPPTIGPELVFENSTTREALEARLTQDQKRSALGKKLKRLLGDEGPQAPILGQGETQMSQQLLQAIQKKCPECRTEKRPGKFDLPEYLVTFPNQFWIVISVDPGAVEVQTPPLEFSEYQKLSNFIQTHLYDVAARLDLKPRVGHDGHTNIGVLSAFDNVHEFALFLLDQVLHPELALGALGEDLRNAPPLAIQDPQQMKNFFQALDDVQSGRITEIADLAERINLDVYFQTTEFNRSEHTARHYQQVSVKRISHKALRDADAPFEVRNTSARRTFKLVLLNYELIIKRIEYLKKHPELLAARKELGQEVLAMTPKEKLSRFAIFLSEMGLDLDRYRPLISDPDIANTRVDSFVSGQIRPQVAESFNEVARYIPDLNTSPWVRKQMRLILQDPNATADFRNRLLALISAAQTKMGAQSEIDRFDIDVMNNQTREAPQPSKGGPGESCRQVLKR